MKHCTQERDTRPVPFDEVVRVVESYQRRKALLGLGGAERRDAQRKLEKLARA